MEILSLYCTVNTVIITRTCQRCNEKQWLLVVTITWITSERYVDTTQTAGCQTGRRVSCTLKCLPADCLGYTHNRRAREVAAC